MVKLKVTRTDGTIIEAEGPPEELMQLNLIPWYINPYYGTSTGTGTIAGAGTINIGAGQGGQGGSFTIPTR